MEKQRQLALPVSYPLISITKQSDGWVALYANGRKYLHETELEARQLHRFEEIK